MRSVVEIELEIERRVGGTFLAPFFVVGTRQQCARPKVRREKPEGRRRGSVLDFFYGKTGIFQVGKLDADCRAFFAVEKSDRDFSVTPGGR